MSDKNWMRTIILVSLAITFTIGALSSIITYSITSYYDNQRLTETEKKLKIANDNLEEGIDKSAFRAEKEFYRGIYTMCRIINIAIFDITDEKNLIDDCINLMVFTQSKQLYNAESKGWTYDPKNNVPIVK